MRHTPRYLMTDPLEVKRLIRGNPWATFVSPASTGLVASHYPALLIEDEHEIVIASHFGRPDEQLHELGDHEVLVIIQGPHDYVSPSLYAAGDLVPTWNHVTAHLYGTPELLDEEENLRVLSSLTDHFEQHVADPRGLHLDPDYSAQVAIGTVGIRLRITRFDARLKLSQGKPEEVRDRIVAQLEADGPYAHPGLAREMRRLDDHRDS